MIIDAAKEKQEEGCDDDGYPIKACEDVIMDASCNIQDNTNLDLGLLGDSGGSW